MGRGGGELDSFGVKRVLEITIKIMITIKTLNPNRNHNLNPGPFTSDVYAPTSLITTGALMALQA